MTPRALAEWNVSAIIEILSKGLFETEEFDSRSHCLTLATLQERQDFEVPAVRSRTRVADSLSSV